MELVINDIKKAQSTNLWTVGNKVLYDLCEKYPFHNNKKEIISKIWLIGRSYSAAIERRRENRNISNDQFYDLVIGEGLLKKGPEIDTLIQALKSYSCISIENMDLILRLHSLMTDIFQKLTGLNKRSLASKYLHFHLPNLFFIYDSRALKAINKFNKSHKISNKAMNFDYHNDDYDEDYAVFVSKMYALNNEIHNQFSIWLMPRQIDNLLLDF